MGGSKIISYKFIAGERNIGTKEKPIMEQIVRSAEIVCPTQAVYDANYPIAEKEAIEGSIEISGEFDEVSTEPTAQDDTDAMLVDHEYRLTLLELFTDMTV